MTLEEANSAMHMLQCTINDTLRSISSEYAAVFYFSAQVPGTDHTVCAVGVTPTAQHSQIAALTCELSRLLNEKYMQDHCDKLNAATNERLRSGGRRC